MLYAFDLDGTLVDSKDAVLRAYRAVGVEPPEDFFGKPWHAWLQDEDKHDAKNLVYCEHIHRVKKLPLADMLPQLRSMRGAPKDPYAQIHILTGASRKAAERVVSYLLHERLDSLATGLTMEAKALRLNELTSANAAVTGFYFDDDETTCNYLRENTKWTVLHVRY